MKKFLILEVSRFHLDPLENSVKISLFLKWRRIRIATWTYADSKIS